MTVGDESAIPRRGVRPSFKNNVPRIFEGAGNAGRTMRPQPRTQRKKRTSVVTTVTPVSPDIPRAMVYGL